MFVDQAQKNLMQRVFVITSVIIFHSFAIFEVTAGTNAADLFANHMKMRGSHVYKCIQALKRAGGGVGKLIMDPKGQGVTAEIENLGGVNVRAGSDSSPTDYRRPGFATAWRPGFQTPHIIIPAQKVGKGDQSPQGIPVFHMANQVEHLTWWLKKIGIKDYVIKIINSEALESDPPHRVSPKIVVVLGNIKDFLRFEGFGGESGSPLSVSLPFGNPIIFRSRVALRLDEPTAIDSISESVRNQLQSVGDTEVIEVTVVRWNRDRNQVTVLRESMTPGQIIEARFDPNVVTITGESVY